MRSRNAGYILLTTPAGVLALGEESGATAPGSISLASDTLMQMVVGTGLILLLIGLAAWILRRYMVLRGNGGLINIRGGLALGSRERIVLVEARGVHLLLGVSPGRIQTLHVFDPACSGVEFAAELARADTHGKDDREGSDVGHGSTRA